MSMSLENLFALMRIKEWAEKLQVNFVAAFILLVNLPQPQAFLRYLFIFGTYVIFLACYGYVINSYGDRDQDAKIGKHLEIYHFSNFRLLLIAGFFFLGSIGIPLAFQDFKITLLGFANIFLTTFYSLRPLRFKERGFIGIIAATLAQRPMPFLFFAFLVSVNLKLVLLLFFWLSLYGMLYMLAHQIEDFENDRRAGVYTWAQKIGIDKTKKWAILTSALTFLFIFIPVFIFPVYNGLAISFVLLAFSKNPIEYFVYSLKSI